MKLKSSLSILALACTMVFTSCSKDESSSEKKNIVQEVTYDIFDVANSGVTGTATFTHEDNGSTHVLIELNGSDTSINPAFINYNSAAVGGDVAISLKVCTCSISNTTITKFDNGETITFEELIGLNGHITILDDNDVIVAVANIGSNAI